MINFTKSIISLFVCVSFGCSEASDDSCDLVLSEINSKHQETQYWDQQVSIYVSYYQYILDKWSSAENAFYYFKSNDLTDADVRSEFSKYGPSLLYSALINRNTEQIEFYLKNKIDPIKHYNGFGKVLLTAAELGEPDIYKLFSTSLKQRRDAQDILKDIENYHYCLEAQKVL